jgi:ferredoxin
MPARDSEIKEALDEGVILKVLALPTKLIGENGRLTKVECIENELGEPDESGRRRPVPVQGSEYLVEAETLINAVGQTSDLSFLGQDEGVESEWELIKVDPGTFQTTAPDVFAGGDVAYGPRYFIDAIASAQIAARSIHDYLREKRTDVVVRTEWVPASYTMAEGWEELERRDSPLIEAAERATSLDPVEQVYPEEEARREGSRCLRCKVNTVFDTSICVACQGCVEVCPESIIKLVGLSRLAPAEDWQRQASLSFRVALEDLKFMKAEQLDPVGSVMWKDETTCIRCADCASRCPTQAVTMQEFRHFRECVSHPTRNPKLKYGDELR